jgi:dienelactone hydrolase
LIERAVSFGARARLAGVLTLPAAGARTDTPAVMLWNVGLHHHVGPYRFHVDLARELARHGFLSLRFDLSGLGDSEVRRDALGEMERALDDLREAARLLEQREGRTRVVPVGFCSSVDAAHNFALADDRVAGVCFIEGYAHRTPGFYARYPLRLLDRARWRRLVARKIPNSLRGAPLIRRLGRIPLVNPDDGVYRREYPPPEQLQRDYGALAAKGTRMLFVYVGKDANYNHREQLFEFADAPGLAPLVDIEYYGNADHTFYLPENRAAAVRRVCSWADEAWPARPAPAPAVSQ